MVSNRGSQGKRIFKYQTLYTVSSKSTRKCDLKMMSNTRRGTFLCVCPPKEVDSAIHSSRSNRGGRERNAGRIDIGQNVYGKPCYEVFKTFYNIKEGQNGREYSYSNQRKYQESQIQGEKMN